MPRRPSIGNISSPYGPRTHPITGKPQAEHTGEDIGHAAGVALVAPLACTVVSYGPHSGYGNRMVLVGQQGGVRVEIWLCHLASSNAVVGLAVAEGSRVATMGSTGNSTGVHVHWEVRLNGVRVDPAQWLTSTAGGGITPITEESDTMKIIRHPNGTITGVGETTYQHYRDTNEYICDAALYGPYLQCNQDTYNLMVSNTQVRRAYLLAGISGGSGVSVDADAIVAKVTANLEKDYAALTAQIAAINQELDAPSPIEIAHAFGALLSTNA